MNGPGFLLSFPRDSNAAAHHSQSSSPSPSDPQLIPENNPDILSDFSHHDRQRYKSQQKRGNIPNGFFKSVNTGEGIPFIEAPEPSPLNSQGKIRKVSSPRKLSESSLNIGQSSGNSESHSHQRERRISSPRKFKHLELAKEDKNNRLISGEEKLESPRIISTPLINCPEPAHIRGREFSKKKSVNRLFIDDDCSSRSPSPSIEKSEETKDISPRSEGDSKSPRRQRNTIGSSETPSSIVQYKRSLYSSKTSAVEIRSKKKNVPHLIRPTGKESKDSDSLITFRDLDLKKIREALVAPSVDYHVKKQIKVKKFNELSIKRGQKINKTFMKKMKELEKSASPDEKLKEIVDKILTNEINGVIHKQLVPNADRVKEGKHDLVTIVQNTLLLSTNFFKLLNQSHDLVLDLAIANEHTSYFLNSLHLFLNNLTFIKSIEDKKNLLDWGVSIPDFLDQFELMQKTSCASEEVKLIINSIFGPHKGSILAFLNEWNPPKNVSKKDAKTPFMPAQLENMINEITDKCIKLRKATSYEHFWEEPVDHQYEKQVFPPFNLIPLKDVIEYYFREEALEIPIFINGESIFDDSRAEAQLKTDRSKYCYNLFSKLLEALGHKVRKIKNAMEPSLEEELETLLKHITIKTNPDGGQPLTVEELKVLEEIMFSPEIRQCFELLRLGGIESWGRAEYYINQRFGLFDKPVETKTFLNKQESKNYNLEIRKLNNLCLNFQIKKNQECFVDQRRTVAFNVQYQRDDVKAEMLVSWKVHFPVNGSLRCILRPLEIAINSQGGNHIIEEIENHLINYGTDEVIQQKLAIGGIKIHSLLNNAYMKDTKGVTMFVPKKKLL